MATLYTVVLIIQWNFLVVYKIFHNQEPNKGERGGRDRILVFDILLKGHDPKYAYAKILVTVFYIPSSWWL